MRHGSSAKNLATRAQVQANVFLDAWHERSGAGATQGHRIRSCNYLLDGMCQHVCA